MKKAMLALMLCLGVTACLGDPADPADDPPATSGEDTASQSQAELQVTGHELDPERPRTNSCFVGAQGCVAGWRTCNFECCDGAIGAVPSACGNCLGHANDFCQTFGHGGTFTAWWSP